MERERKTTGGIIVAAGKISEKSEACPLRKIGSITIIKRIVLTFQKAGVSNIVVVTGYRSQEVEHNLAYYGVIFLYNPKYEDSQMIDSIKIGLNFLKNKCDQVIVNPVNVPLFTPETIQKMIEYDKELLSPCYHSKIGHPILISSKLIPEILKYNGDKGMEGAIQNIGVSRYLMDVEDEGILNGIGDPCRLEKLLRKHNQRILHPFVKISIEKETLFFNSRTKLLLLLIQNTHSVRNACKHMALSYSKAWNMLNQLEEELGYAVVKRKHGGRNGGKTYLTKEGEEFLKRYEQFEHNVRQYAKDEFDRLFQK
ncbi:LysR family transcriptional regulator [Clostridium carboxidivorans P7]|uniref:Regulatory protein LysR n=1 Tax=Clostridium carboxidivorans P7 TaxID=536227 RepID=C6PTJ1_9CLOT|nr:NTP transferase domain-containing protein [Clostridium carboxidivorans]AKN31790.1 LysR family transcriptional regulator [Clostridium carboxidivorans P7]EET87421.1 regulatory protein LysR [Clostridium carboxidivorans P7]EFG87379.1 transcriptional regulator, LysR family [Clostridium carboxidivorans P7]